METNEINEIDLDGRNYKVLPKYSKIDLTDPSLRLNRLVEIFDIAEPIIEIYNRTLMWEEVVNFLKSIPDFPKNKIPRAKNSIMRFIYQLKKEAKPEKRKGTRYFLNDIFKNLDKIFQLDAGPQGAVLQNLIKACAKRIVDLEMQSEDGVLNKNIEDAIIKYIAEIRLLMNGVVNFSEQIQEMQANINRHVREEVSYILDAVKDAFLEVAPSKLDKFQVILNKKLTNIKKRRIERDN